MQPSLLLRSIRCGTLQSPISSPRLLTTGNFKQHAPRKFSTPRPLLPQSWSTRQLSFCEDESPYPKRSWEIKIENGLDKEKYDQLRKLAKEHISDFASKIASVSAHPVLRSTTLTPLPILRHTLRSMAEKSIESDIKVECEPGSTFYPLSTHQHLLHDQDRRPWYGHASAALDCIHSPLR